jgi:hypothetical protein
LSGAYGGSSETAKLTTLDGVTSQNINVLRKFYIAGFEILTYVALKIAIFWDVTPCSHINKIIERIGGKNIK